MGAFFTILAAAVTIFVLVVVGTQIVFCVQDKQKSDDIETSNTAIDRMVSLKRRNKTKRKHRFMPRYLSKTSAKPQ